MPTFKSKSSYNSRKGSRKGSRKHSSKGYRKQSKKHSRKKKSDDECDGYYKKGSRYNKEDKCNKYYGKLVRPSCTYYISSPYQSPSYSSSSTSSPVATPKIIPRISNNKSPTISVVKENFAIPMIDKNEKIEVVNKKDDSKTNNECCICYDEIKKKIALVPCGHTSYCHGCATKLSTCSLCNQKIITIISLY
ncbi:zinc finger C3HC4-type protein [Fadolivirus algeromassiliense]|jgi:hypothetical protein|uniref:Zinc finger C3HC4-type protein n=1 Tax=Fadolivirus FV1/VV64 TaxID=3070911 RepID=A0A7D3V631_9VIRU|nr:zinc finger C3HC4-type protein [Fadolivirus algeromassiliense]QKF94812.1 zinc finger C3HC4-type protein [Fadolivirus FV1/VV64]